jgi:hypothetical protein
MSDPAPVKYFTGLLTIGAYPADGALQMAGVNMLGTREAVVPIRAGKRPTARWMGVAAGQIGALEEVRKQGGEVAVQDYLASQGFAGANGEPWCAVFVRWVLGQSGVTVSRKLDSEAWQGWGRRSGARLGAVAAFEDPEADGAGYVGFYVGESVDRVFVLGGITWLQGRYAPGVGVRAYTKTRLQGYRWPSEMRGARAQSVVSVLRLPGRVRVQAHASVARWNRLAFGSDLRSDVGERRETPDSSGQSAPQALLGVLRQFV